MTNAMRMSLRILIVCVFALILHTRMEAYTSALFYKYNYQINKDTEIRNALFSDVYAEIEFYKRLNSWNLREPFNPLPPSAAGEVPTPWPISQHWRKKLYENQYKEQNYTPITGPSILFRREKGDYDAGLFYDGLLTGELINGGKEVGSYFNGNEYLKMDYYDAEDRLVCTFDRASYRLMVADIDKIWRFKISMPRTGVVLTVELHPGQCTAPDLGYEDPN